MLQRSVQSARFWLMYSQSTVTSLPICSAPYGTRLATSGDSLVPLVMGPSMNVRAQTSWDFSSIIKFTNSCAKRMFFAFLTISIATARATVPSFG